MTRRTMSAISNILLAAAIMETNLSGAKYTEPNYTEPKREPIIPKGCKEYYFDRYGWYRTNEDEITDVVFKCIASNNKVAMRKFVKWEFKNK